MKAYGDLGLAGRRHQAHRPAATSPPTRSCRTWATRRSASSPPATIPPRRPAGEPGLRRRLEARLRRAIARQLHLGGRLGRDGRDLLRDQGAERQDRPGQDDGAARRTGRTRTARAARSRSIPRRATSSRTTTSARSEGRTASSPMSSSRPSRRSRIRGRYSTRSKDRTPCYLRLSRLRERVGVGCRPADASERARATPHPAISGKREKVLAARAGLRRAMDAALSASSASPSTASPTRMVLYLISVGLSVTMGLMGFVNLAHGVFAMAGGYVAVSLMNRAGVPLRRAPSPPPVVAVALASVLLERLLYSRLYGAGELDQVLFTIGLVFMAAVARSSSRAAAAAGAAARLPAGPDRDPRARSSRPIAASSSWSAPRSSRRCGSASSARASARWSAPPSTTGAWRSRSASTRRRSSPSPSRSAAASRRSAARSAPTSWRSSRPTRRSTSYSSSSSSRSAGSAASAGRSSRRCCIGIADTACKYLDPRVRRLLHLRRDDRRPAVAAARPVRAHLR